MAIWTDRIQDASFEGPTSAPSRKPRLVGIAGRARSPELEARAFNAVAETSVNWDAVRRQTGARWVDEDF
jgi:hypothetical protein